MIKNNNEKIMNDITAAIIIIGNEILSGRTQDLNINYIAKELALIGIKLTHVRIIPDIEQEIIDNVNELKAKYTYIFTSGGIGPTHDDITSSSIAKAFNVELIYNREAVKILEDFYGDQLNESRLRMAMIPDTATLIQNSISKAPGYYIENVYVFAGIPKICQAMFGEIKSSLAHGKIIHTKNIQVFTGEGNIAAYFADLQGRYVQVDMGSYPFKKDEKWGTELVLKSSDQLTLNKAFDELTAILKNLNIETE